MYIKVHAYLAAYMNILRKNLCTMCITSQTVAYDVTAARPISEETAEK